MRVSAMILTLALVSSILAADPPTKSITPAEAAKKVNEKATVELEVKSTGGKEMCFLNSEDFKDAKNFTVFVPSDVVEKYKKAKIDDVQGHFKGKTIRVTGTVTLYREKPQIKVEEPSQIEVVEKK